MRPAVRSFALCLPMIASGTAFAAEAPLVPLRDFFRNPVQTAYQISPDGDFVAFLAPWNNRLNVWVGKVGEDKPVRVTAEEKRDIRTFVWTTDDRVVYAQDKGGDENFALYSVKRDGTGLLPLTPTSGVRADIVDVPYRDHRHIIVQHNQRDSKVFDAFRVDVETGKSELLVQNPGDVTGYQDDHDGVIRIETVTDGVNSKVLYRATAADPFKTVLETNFRETLTPQVFTADNKHLYAISNIGRDKAALVELDPATGKELKLLYENPEVDVDTAMWSDARQKLTGVTYTTDRPHYAFFDKEREALQHQLETKLPDWPEVRIASSDDAEQHFIVKGWSDRSRGDFFSYDKKAGKLTHIADPSPWIKPAEMAPMQAVTYQSRDGITLHAYLTVPAGVPAKNLPMVLNPHGGPWARDDWGFDPEVQFLANRGYAVLQVNYRGSTGYGRKFWELGFGQWGRTMQDDLTDGVKEIISRGIADPKRVGIYGGSYGGYATLAGVTFTPDLYAAAVDYVGVANLLTFMNTIPPYWRVELDMMHEMVGKDETTLKAESPINSADRIRTPLLIAQGANDPRVNKNESDQMVKALTARGVDVPYMVKANEGHGFHNEENRFDFYRAMEQFFGKYLHGRIAPGDDVLASLETAKQAVAAPPSH